MRQATAADIDEFFGQRPRRTLRAFAVEMDGRVEGVVGVSREKEFGKFFADYSEALEPHLRSITVMRAVKKAMELVKSYGGPVISVASHGEGARLLTRLGFTHGMGPYFIWLN